MNENINEWLDSCPKPVISRVVTDAVDLRFLAISTHVYEDNTLVVTTLETLKALIDASKMLDSNPLEINRKQNDSV